MKFRTRFAFRGLLRAAQTVSHTIHYHPWDDCIFTYMNSCFFYGKLVGKYTTRLMEPSHGYDSGLQERVKTWQFSVTGPFRVLLGSKFQKCYTPQIIGFLSGGVTGEP